MLLPRRLFLGAGGKSSPVTPQPKGHTMNWILLNLPLVALAAGLTVVPILRVTLGDNGDHSAEPTLATVGSDRAHR
jgi:hypothetical protein